MAKKNLISPQDLKQIFPLEYGPQMTAWLRDYCHDKRRGNSYHFSVIKKLVDKGYTIRPNFIRGQRLRYEDPNFQITIDGKVRSQTPGPYSWDYVSTWAAHAGYTLHFEFMFDKEGNKYMCLAWKQFPNYISVLTNKGLMYADPNGVLRPCL
ncbi:hypothetical protein LCALLHIG_00001 [Klebsiella phage vB_KppS-Raw]|nr:hypothetical protein LCALLHIG_00001 [Klebsiella phage vB_KppS-Raw]CAD5235885.1 hypothetical protein OPBIHMGG_00027 [Klebsiella phage vB_KppS-Eggy]